MSFYVERKVFDPNLLGKACKLKGYSVDGEHFDCYALVKGTDGEKISFILYTGMKLTFSIEDFDHGEDSLEINILEVENID